MTHWLMENFADEYGFLSDNYFIVFFIFLAFTAFVWINFLYHFFNHDLKKKKQWKYLAYFTFATTVCSLFILDRVQPKHILLFGTSAQSEKLADCIFLSKKQNVTINDKHFYYENVLMDWCRGHQKNTK